MLVGIRAIFEHFQASPTKVDPTKANHVVTSRRPADLESTASRAHFRVIANWLRFFRLGALSARMPLDVWRRVSSTLSMRSKEFQLITLHAPHHVVVGC